MIDFEVGFLLWLLRFRVVRGEKAGWVYRSLFAQILVLIVGVGGEVSESFGEDGSR